MSIDVKILSNGSYLENLLRGALKVGKIKDHHFGKKIKTTESSSSFVHNYVKVASGLTFMAIG